MRLAVALAVLAGCVPDDPAGAPKADVCSRPGALGPGLTVELGGPEEPFAPWPADGATTRLIVGGQGSDMIGVRARVLGSGVPSCIALDLELRDGLGTRGTRSSFVSTYADGAGRSTRPLYVPLSFASSPPDSLIVNAHVGAYPIAREVTLSR